MLASKGGSIMESLNERIKNLRKEKGLTQGRLADMLGITDKAVSKWEVGEANPDLALLPKIAEVFGVTLDYLILGKKEEPAISLDDMDSEKRALYLIKKDDAVRFKKYGYLSPSIFFTNLYSGGRDGFRDKILEAIYQEKSRSIFQSCVVNAIRDRNVQQQLQRGGALCVRGDLDKFVRMCALCDCREGMEAIDLKHFSLGNATSTKDAVPFLIETKHSPADTDYCAFVLSWDTLDYIFSLKDSSPNVLKYLSEVEFFEEGGKKVYLMTDGVIWALYKNGKVDLVKRILSEMETYNEKAKAIYDQSLFGSWYTGKRFCNGAIYFLNNSHGEDSYLKALVTPISKALTLALEKKDTPWIRTFNEYNRKLNNLFPKANAYVIEENKVRIMEIEQAGDAPIESIFELEFVKNGVLDLHGLLETNYGIKESDKIKAYESLLKRLKSLKPFVDSHFISPYEFILHCTTYGDWKGLFKFASDISFRRLEEAVVASDKDLVEGLAAEFFLPSQEDIERLETRISSANRLEVGFGSHIDEETVDAAHATQRQKVFQEEEKRIVDTKLQSHGDEIDADIYGSLLSMQFHNIPLGTIYREMNLDVFKKLKDNAFDEQIGRYEDAILTLTNRRALEREYETTTKELNKEFLLAELAKGEGDKVVVLICKRLEIILRHNYGYSGDLFTMMDSLFAGPLSETDAFKPYDDEDNNYDSDMKKYEETIQENERKRQTIKLLSKLRMKRNSIVHVEARDVSISTSEIKQCIEIIENL